MWSVCLHDVASQLVVRVHRFKLPYPDQVLGLPTGQHITLKYVKADGEEVLKPYTPITDDDTVGHVDFVIKVRPHWTSCEIVPCTFADTRSSAHTYSLHL